MKRLDKILSTFTKALIKLEVLTGTLDAEYDDLNNQSHLVDRERKKAYAVLNNLKELLAVDPQ